MSKFILSFFKRLTINLRFGRGGLQNQSSEINSINFPAIMKFVAFDSAIPLNRDDPFELRYEQCMGVVNPFDPLIVSYNSFLFLKYLFDDNHVLATVSKCKSTRQLNTLLNFIYDGGGEGMVCREPNSTYQPGKSESLKKIKVLGILNSCILHLFNLF